MNKQKRKEKVNNILLGSTTMISYTIFFVYALMQL